MNKNNNNEVSKSSSHIYNSANNIRYSIKNNKNNKNKPRRKEFFAHNEYSYEIEIDEKPELNSKHMNESEFKPSTKQTIDKYKYKKLQQECGFEIIDEEEEEQVKEDKNSKINSGKKTPPSRVMKNIYTEKNKRNEKVILDDDEDVEIKIEGNINNSSDYNKEEEDDDNKNNKYNNKHSKGIKSEGGDFEHRLKFKKNKNRNNKDKYEKKWDEEEYQKIKSEAKNYLSPFQKYDIKQFILTPSEMNNIERIPELYKKYSDFLSLKKKQDEKQSEILIKNILIGLNNIYKKKTYLKRIDPKKLPSLIVEHDINKFKYKSTEKTAFFDLFISFITMYVNEFDNFVKLASIQTSTDMIKHLHILAFIFSSQVFFLDVSKLIKKYYNNFLSDKIIPIYLKDEEEYRNRIHTRKIIFDQFKPAHLYYRDIKQLYSKGENNEIKMNDNNVKKYSEEIKNNTKKAYDEIPKKIFEKHKKINLFSINDENITITNNEISAPSSLYQQIKNDPLFKLKMNLYKYKNKQLSIKRAVMINEAKYSENEFNNIVRNKIFKQSVFYMSPCDVVQDFLDNYD